MKARNLLPVILLLLAGCQLNESVSLTLPPQSPKFVVEAILKPGMPMELTFIESSMMNDTISSSYVKGATAFFVVDNDTIRLKNQLYIRPEDNVVINYTSSVPLPNRESGSIALLVASGTDTLSAHAYFIKPITIKECRATGLDVAVTIDNIYESEERLFRMEVYLYREKKREAKHYQIYNLSKETTPELTLQLKVGDTKRDSLKVVLSHISHEHYEYIYSYTRALDAYYNLFTVPTPIKTNIRGGVGVFTVVMQDKRGLRSVYP